MSRIDEALRRAAQEQGTILPPPAQLIEDETTLPRESILVDMSEHRRARPAPSHGTPSHGTSPQPATGELPESRPLGAGSVFQHIDNRLAEKVIVDDTIMPLSREQYRRLAGVLHDAQAERGLKVILVASAVAGEGKTLTSVNLALTLSESYGRNVLLVDGDLRRPALHDVFKINTVTGLADALSAREDMKLTLHRVSNRLTVLPAGRPQSDPMAGLASERMKRMVDEARETFDWVIIDTPPLVLLPDAPLMAASADGVILVVRADSTPHNLVKRAIDSLKNAPVLGVVLNGATTPVHGAGDYYSSYYGPRERGDRG
jgi:capsular exopolysaccharide synthesis family protein